MVELTRAPIIFAGLLTLAVAGCGEGASRREGVDRPSQTQSGNLIVSGPMADAFIRGAEQDTDEKNLSDMLAATIAREAIEAEYSRTLSDCLEGDEAARGVTAAMAECINAELRDQDRRLNTAYLDAMARLDGPAQIRLQTDERAWIEMRDRRCAAASSGGGTMDLLNIPSCLMDETIKRRLALETVVYGAH